MITADEIERKRPVWIAMSEFYLDTELETKDFERIANIFIESRYTVEELKRINYEEVGPVVSLNLLSMAGVWSGFDEEWLQAQILKRINGRKSKGIFDSIYRRFVNSSTKRYWKPIEEMMNLAKNGL